MKTALVQLQTDTLHEEIALLEREVAVSRRAAEITADLVVEQFSELDKVMRRLEETLASEHRQNAYLAALHETTLGLMSRLDLGGLLEVLLQRAGQLLETRHGFIYLKDSEGNALECRVGFGVFEAAIGSKQGIGQGIAGRIWETGEPLNIDHYDDWTGDSENAKFNVHKAVMGVPLKSGGEVVGVVGLAHGLETCQTFGDDSVALLTRFAELASIALDNARLYAEAEQARRVAQEADRSKSEFLANMSHEIRTPMNAIIGMAGLAQKLELSPKLRNYLNVIENSAHSLLDLINDILDFSKIEAGKLTIETTDFQLRAVLDTLSDMFSEKAAQKGIEMIISVDDDVPCALMGDPLRLGQVLINLTANAVKFSPEGEILIKVTCLEKRDDFVRLQFSVSDNGIGLSEDQIGRLFHAFTQADSSTTRKYGGTGLGLTICRHLVEQMGGGISVQSEQGKGSTFTVVLPFERQAEEKEQTLALPLDIRNLRALVVDDNESSRIIMGEMLKSFNFMVDTASSGEEAIERVKANLDTRERFDLLLMDWRMPGLDGISTSMLLKNEERFGNTRIIMMTAVGREEEMRRAESVGVDAFLFKPIKQSLLFDTIMDVFGSREAASSHRAERSGAKTRQGIEDLRGARILLAEDNAINQEVAREILQSAGMEVEIANNGKEAVHRILKETFDLVLMDVQMPEMDGYQATQLVRQDPLFAALPVIAMTAHAMKGDREKCLGAGMNDYVSKPIDTEHLFAVLCKWLPPKGARRSGSAPRKSPPAVKECREFPAILPGIDLEAGLRRLGGNRELFCTLIQSFASDYRTLVGDLRAALESGDTALAARLAHTLKGASGNLSANDLYASVVALEGVLSGREPGDLDPALDRVDAAMTQVLESARTLEQPDPEAAPASTPPPPGAEHPADLTQAEPLFRRLLGLLEENNLEAEEALTDVVTLLKGSAHHELMRLLEDQVSRFNFKDAIATLGSLATAVGLSWEPKA